MKYFLLLFFYFSCLLQAEKTPQRIISLAPSITEILCSLDLQEKIVGVTDFCKDPYKNRDFQKLRVGGIINPNFEKMIKSRPDVIFTLKGKGDLASKLEKYGLKVITLDHVNLDGVFKSILTIGQTCAVKEKADTLHAGLSSHLVEKDYSQGKRVLITISRLSAQSNIRLWVAGNDGFYSRLLNLCGAKNALEKNERFSQINVEALIKLNPDVIILLRDKMSDKEKQEEIEFWKKLPTLKAIKEKQFHIITGDEIMIPGPRFPSVLKKFKAVLNNE